MDSLTPKQKQFYDSLISFFRRHQRLPSHREAADINGLQSKNSSLQYHQALEEKGYLERDESGNYRFTSAVDIWPGSDEAGTSIPVLGEITAGAMQEAVQADLGEITFSHLFPNVENVFALRVKGMSMSGLDISDGDYVLLSKTELRNGDVGAVLYNGETTLKKVHKEKDRIRLKPANPEFDDLVIEPDEAEEVQTLGKYLGHINQHGLFKSPY
ncbi:transcriptional repressor LexA [Halalkalibaculum sp. DA3122]|uniref:transcriptional repressor LexA n=1 Tax=Halalkalibaculum sp. DA3122 TaxID=3373607 RepID=UPI0037545D03